MRFVELEKLCNSQAALTSAYRSALKLQERGWMRYPACSWDKPAIIAFDGAECVAGVNFFEDEDDRVLRVDFAWCTRPAALTGVLARLRRRSRDGKCEEITFVCHEGNEPMARAVRLFGAEVVSHAYRVPIRRAEEVAA